MELRKFLDNNNSALNISKRFFVENVLYPVISEHGLDLLEVQANDKKSIDFIIVTNHANYGIKIIGQEEGEEEGKEGSSFLPNLKLKIFEGNKIVDNTIDIVNEMRRWFVADEQLNIHAYLKYTKGIKPYEPQQEALESIENARVQGISKGLVSLATGLGKTYLAAFDAKRISGHTLFLVHRNEILEQAKESFDVVWPESSKGYYHGIEKSMGNKVTFASIQTISRKEHLEHFSPDYFDYIIIDETHHSVCKTYQKIITHFTPKFLLGLTATPERMDRKDVLESYDGNLIFELSQQDSIERGYLAPFKYHGFKDDIDYDQIYWNGFKYKISDLNKILIIDRRDERIIEKFKEKAKDKKSIGFCVSIEHAVKMAEKFNKAGVSAEAIHSDIALLSAEERKDLTDRFRANEIQVVFAVDIFNEGVDFPDVECLLFLRPTESKTIFVQQLGRGLRISPGKENVMVLDFIGNYKTANRIYSYLGVKKIGDLKRDREKKEVCHYDNNGNEVRFDEEVLEVFKVLDCLEKPVRLEDLSGDWVEYGEFLKEWTNNNLYWKRGQQNQYFEVQLEALDIISKNPEYSEKEFVEHIQKVVNERYPGKNMTAGYRALMLSKIAGFVTAKTPLEVTDSFRKVKERCLDFSQVEEYRDILTDQLEKVYYWNSIYGTYSKYVPAAKRVSFKDFKIYPFFLIYNVLLRLQEVYGDEGFLNKIEFNSFLAIARNYSEADDALDRIVSFRKNEERYQLEKYLKSQNKIDPRFYTILHYNKYIVQVKNGIKLNNAYLDELFEKINKFNALVETDQLIHFDESKPDEYLSLLYSDKDILTFHGVYNECKKRERKS